jgi:hypothetical protein
VQGIPLISTSNATVAGSAEWPWNPRARWAENRIEQTSPVGKFTFDESFDVGEDTGTPEIDEYDAKMPSKFWQA